MTEHSAHAPHHSHVRKSIDALYKHHAALVADHRTRAAAEAERRIEQLQARIAAAGEPQP